MSAPSRLPRFPLLPGLYHVVVLGPNKVLIANAGRSVVLSGGGFAEKVAPLLTSLDGTRTLHELESRFGSLASEVVAGLTTKGLVTEAVPRDGPNAMAITLCATAFPAAGPAADVAARITGSTVAVAGCGPVGGSVALLLAKAGIGRLLLADSDLTSAGEVVTSPFVAGTEPGRSRAGSLLAACGQAGTVADVVDWPLTGEILAGVDLAVIEDAYRSSPDDAAACQRSRVPYLLFAQDGLEATVGPLVTAGGVPCHLCAASRQLSHIEHLDEHLAYRQHRVETAPRADAFLAAHTAVVAGLIATESLRVLVGLEPTTGAGVVLVDLAAGTLEREELLPVPGCAGCDPIMAGMKDQVDG